MKNFNEIYEKIYKKNYKIIEEKRKMAKNKTFFIVILIILIGLFIFINSADKYKIYILLIIIIMLFCLRKNNRYNIEYKQLVINDLIEEYDSNLEYRYNKSLTSAVYSEGEFESFDRYYSEDYIGGTLANGKTVLISDVKTEKRRTDSDGKTYYDIIFQGLFARITIDKDIDSTTKIRKNSFKLINSKNSLDMDSGEFEKIFDVYSEGKVTTMQILTLDTMQKIVDFKNKTKLTPEFTIKDNNIYIRFLTPTLTITKNDREFFEGNVLKSSLDYNTLKYYYDILNFIEIITDEIVKNIKNAGI